MPFKSYNHKIRKQKFYVQTSDIEFILVVLSVSVMRMNEKGYSVGRFMTGRRYKGQFSHKIFHPWCQSDFHVDLSIKTDFQWCSTPHTPWLLVKRPKSNNRNRQGPTIIYLQT